MTENQDILKLIQSHKVLDPFDYKLVVDWAIELIQNGKESENILILASFSEPIDGYEISPYVTTVLDELGLEELEYKGAIIAKANFHINNILKGISIRKNLDNLMQLCINNGYDSDLMNFYLIYYAWDQLESIGENYYFEGVTLENIEETLKKEGRKWIDKCINGNEIEETQQNKN